MLATLLELVEDEAATPTAVAVGAGTPASA
jgi:hypothetical protein